MDNIFVILINYNGYKDTLNCIESIKKSNINTTILVIDNNSTDNSIKELKKVKDIVLIELEENLGFAKGNNIGINYALKHKADFIMLLNNDTIIEANTISILVNNLKEHKDIGAVGARIMYYDQPELINYCGGYVDWKKGIPVHKHYKEKFENNFENFIYTTFITGCCVMVKKDVFIKVGLLPEEYFMYFEDVDFCMKIIEANYKLGVCTNAVVFHKVSASSGGEESIFSIKWITRNRLIFVDKYKKYTKGMFTYLFIYITRYIKILIYIFQRKKAKKQAIIEGIIEGRKYIKYRRDKNENIICSK